MQVEISVQDCIGDIDNLIPAETWETWFYRWLENLQAELPPASGYELSLRLTGDREIQALNAQYRAQDRPTDVLSFAALEADLPQLEETLYLGDIVISVDTANRQAQEQGHSLRTELVWLAAHALLHLLGWDHPDEESLTRMLNQQAHLLQAVGIEAPIG